MLPSAGLLIAALLTGPAGSVAVSGSEDDAAGEAVAAEVQANCETGGPAPTKISRKHDVVMGPLVLMGGRRARNRRPDAFAGHGYKIPASLPEGAVATLSVPKAARGHVGLVFSLDTQARVQSRGVKAADRSVRFTACPDEAANGGRTGWPGGFVVDRRRCATLLLGAPGQRPARHRVPLGRRC